jgi:hypothetical protein
MAPDDPFDGEVSLDIGDALADGSGIEAVDSHLRARMNHQAVTATLFFPP